MVRLSFAAGAADTCSLWVNPPPGEPLPAVPNAALTIGVDWTFGQMNFRPQVLNAMTMDEFRMGNSYASVTPFVEAPPLTAVELWRGIWFGSTVNSGSAADAADPDGDGHTNAEEFAAGTDPLAPGAHACLIGRRVSMCHWKSSWRGWSGPAPRCVVYTPCADPVPDRSRSSFRLAILGAWWRFLPLTHLLRCPALLRTGKIAHWQGRFEGATARSQDPGGGYLRRAVRLGGRGASAIQQAKKTALTEAEAVPESASSQVRQEVEEEARQQA